MNPTASSSSVHIDRLDVDLRGIPAPIAREAIASLGPALHHALAGNSPRAGLPARIESLDAGALRLAPGASAETVRTALAQHLAQLLVRPAASP